MLEMEMVRQHQENVANLKKWKKYSGRKIVHEVRRVLIN